MSSLRHQVHVLRPGEIAPSAGHTSHARARTRILALVTIVAAVFVGYALWPRLPSIVANLQAHLALSQFWR